MRRIEDIQTKTHALAVVPNKPRVAYEGVNYLNPSSIAKGFVGCDEFDPSAVKYAFETPYVAGTQAAQDRMDRGTLAHIMLLQPERLQGEVEQWPSDKIRKGGSESRPSEWDEFRAINHGKLIVRSDDYAAVADACREFRTCKALAMLLTDLDAEVAVFGQEGSFYVKGLIDAVTRGELCNIIDLKTTEAGISARACESTMRNFYYREKLGLYKRFYEQHGRPVNTCFDIFLSMKRPYGIRIMEMSTMVEDWAKQRIDRAFSSLEECLASKHWPLFVRSDVAIVSSFESDDDIELEDE